MSVHDYSLLLHVTESRLTSVTKRITGITAGQFVQERSLLEAKRLLIHSGATVSQIAFQLGFDDPAYFSRFFKKGAGRSPKEFKAAFEEALRMRQEYGITTFKVKVGRDPFTDDVAAVRALREALGPDVELYVDGNRGWSASESARAMREMADLDSRAVERASQEGRR